MNRGTSIAQRRLPAIFVEHDPPLAHPTDARHWVEDANVLVEHVTPFNRPMWDNGDVPVRVIDHVLDFSNLKPDHSRFHEQSVLTLIFVRRGDRWVMVHDQNTPVRATV